MTSYETWIFKKKIEEKWFQYFWILNIEITFEKIWDLISLKKYMEDFKCFILIKIHVSYDVMSYVLCLMSTDSQTIWETKGQIIWVFIWEKSFNYLSICWKLFDKFSLFYRFIW
jgi:hypothetical protein